MIGKPRHSFPLKGFNEAAGLTKRFILIDAIDYSNQLRTLNYHLCNLNLMTLSCKYSPSNSQSSLLLIMLSWAMIDFGELGVE